jgi:hypothetical protein
VRTIFRALLVVAFGASACACGSGTTASSDTPDATAPDDGGGTTTVTGGDGALPPSQGMPSPDGGCGYRGAGVPLDVASGIEVCLPPVYCTSETCPPEVGDCVNDTCVFHAGYKGIATVPEAWVTYYCTLSGGGCHGVTQIEFPEITAQKIATARGLPVCDGASGTGECVGISAAPPMLVGNSQVAKDSATGQTVSNWGLGLTEASGLCYELTGPGGKVLVALTDRCGGYCTCNGSALEECGPCVSAADMKPGCPCVGSVPGLYGGCCGNGCGGTVNAQCDWCASNNHPHFDLDTATFNKLCAASSSMGSCKLTGVSFVHCLDLAGWPPGGGGAGSCKSGSFHCAGSQPHQEQAPGTSCCCNWNTCPQADGSCAAAPSTCKAGSCACGAAPDAAHPAVSSTGCCCLEGLTPQSDGTCQ